MVLDGTMWYLCNDKQRNDVNFIILIYSAIMEEWGLSLNKVESESKDKLRLKSFKQNSIDVYPVPETLHCAPLKNLAEERIALVAGRLKWLSGSSVKTASCSVC